MAESLILWLPDEPNGPNARHRYVARIVFEVILCCDYHWAENQAEWLESPHRSVQYGGAIPANTQDGIIWIPSAGLLNEKGSDVPAWIWSDASNESTPGGTRLPFGVRSESDDTIVSDWWSWLFWMTVRLEEYGEHELDAFGRFAGQKTLGYREGWLARPEVEFRVMNWAKAHGIAFQPSDYRVVPTIDVDSAFAYRHRSWFMTLAAAGQDVLKGRWSRFQQRIRVLRGVQPDAYDTYDWLEQQHRLLGMRATYFFLLAKRGKYDRGLSWKSRGLQAQIRSLEETADVGIHPGFAAHDSHSNEAMKTEILRLTEIINAPVIRSRQHYLLQRPRASWRRLEELGIRHDHTLGYADVPGFRAGMSRSFPAYDLIEERIMDLELHPVAAMDATFMRYLQVSPERSVEMVAALADAVRDVGGVLRLLWHNESVSDAGEWMGWKEMYKQMLERVR